MASDYNDPWTEAGGVHVADMACFEKQRRKDIAENPRAHFKDLTGNSSKGSNASNENTSSAYNTALREDSLKLGTDVNSNINPPNHFSKSAIHSQENLINSGPNMNKLPDGRPKTSSGGSGARSKAGASLMQDDTTSMFAGASTMHNASTSLMGGSSVWRPNTSGNYRTIRGRKHDPVLTEPEAATMFGEPRAAEETCGTKLQHFSKQNSRVMQTLEHRIADPKYNFSDSLDQFMNKPSRSAQFESTAFDSPNSKLFDVSMTETDVPLGSRPGTKQGKRERVIQRAVTMAPDLATDRVNEMSPGGNRRGDVELAKARKERKSPNKKGKRNRDTMPNRHSAPGMMDSPNDSEYRRQSDSPFSLNESSPLFKRPESRQKGDNDNSKAKGMKRNGNDIFNGTGSSMFRSQASSRSPGSPGDFGGGRKSTKSRRQTNNANRKNNAQEMQDRKMRSMFGMEHHPRPMDTLDDLLGGLHASLVEGVNPEVERVTGKSKARYKRGKGRDAMNREKFEIEFFESNPYVQRKYADLQDEQTLFLGMSLHAAAFTGNAEMMKLLLFHDDEEHYQQEEFDRFCIETRDTFDAEMDREEDRLAKLQGNDEKNTSWGTSNSGSIPVKDPTTDLKKKIINQKLISSAADEQFMPKIPSINIYLQDQGGETCMHRACANGSLEIVELLLEYEQKHYPHAGAAGEFLAKSGDKFLNLDGSAHGGSHSTHCENISHRLSEMADHEGRTPLFCAAFYGHQLVCERLYQLGYEKKEVEDFRVPETCVRPSSRQGDHTLKANANVL